MPQSTSRQHVESIAREGVAPLHLQPILKADGALYGVEALLRVPKHCPVKVLSASDVFGMRSEVEMAVLASCIKIAEAIPGLGAVHVNVSWKTLIDPKIGASLDAMFSASGLHPSRLIVELSEREKIADQNRASKALQALSRMGVCFAIDDFGVGFNHLSTITSIPIRTLKVDRSIVHAVTRAATPDERERAKRLLLGTKMLSTSLSADFVMEGIEGTDECGLMADLGCAGQGYYLGCPQPVAEMTSLLKIRSAA